MVIVRVSKKASQPRPLPSCRRKAPATDAVRLQSSRCRRTALNDTVAALRGQVEELIIAAAARVNVKSDIVRAQVFRHSTKLLTERAPSAWNAFMRQVAEETNQGTCSISLPVLCCLHIADFRQDTRRKTEYFEHSQ